MKNAMILTAISGWGLVCAPGAYAATITALGSFAEFSSTRIAIEDFETSLDDRAEFSFDSTASQFPSNTGQLARSGLTFFGEIGSNMPLFVLFHEEVYEVGLYAGNDDPNLWGFRQWFHLDAYDTNGVLLGGITVEANRNDAIDQFLGLSSDTVLGSVGIRLVGTNSLARPSIAIDDFGVGFEPDGIVPIPGAAGLGLLGLGLVGVRRRFRKSA